MAWISIIDPDSGALDTPSRMIFGDLEKQNRVTPGKDGFPGRWSAGPSNPVEIKDQSQKFKEITGISTENQGITD